MAFKENPFANDKPVVGPPTGHRKRRVFDDPEELQQLKVNAANTQDSEDDSKVSTVNNAADDLLALVSHTPAVSSPLVTRELGVSSPLVSLDPAVSSPLVGKTIIHDSVSQPLVQALVRREISVRESLDYPLEVETLVGDERMLLNMIGKECRKVGSLTTNWINTEDLKKLFDVDSNGLRNLIFRVKEKGFFSVTARQVGRVGLRRFTLDKGIYQQTLALVSRETAVSSALGQALGTALVSPDSSSDLDLKEIKNNNSGLVIPEVLTRLNATEASFRVALTKMPLAKVQSSLDAFAHDFQFGKKKPLLNVLFGVLESGRPYLSQSYGEAFLAEFKAAEKRLDEIEGQQAMLKEIQQKLRFAEWKEANPSAVEVALSKSQLTRDMRENQTIRDKLLLQYFRNEVDCKKLD